MLHLELSFLIYILGNRSLMHRTRNLSPSRCEYFNQIALVFNTLLKFKTFFSAKKMLVSYLFNKNIKNKRSQLQKFYFFVYFTSLLSIISSLMKWIDNFCYCEKTLQILLNFFSLKQFIENNLSRNVYFLFLRQYYEYIIGFLTGLHNWIIDLQSTFFGKSNFVFTLRKNI